MEVWTFHHPSFSWIFISFGMSSIVSFSVQVDGHLLEPLPPQTSSHYPQFLPFYHLFLQHLIRNLVRTPSSLPDLLFKVRHTPSSVACSPYALSCSSTHTPPPNHNPPFISPPRRQTPPPGPKPDQTKPNIFQTLKHVNTSSWSRNNPHHISTLLALVLLKRR